MTAAKPDNLGPDLAVDVPDRPRSTDFSTLAPGVAKLHSPSAHDSFRVGIFIALTTWQMVTATPIV
jgi:hypothetical protein